MKIYFASEKKWFEDKEWYFRLTPCIEIGKDKSGFVIWLLWGMWHIEIEF